MCNAFIVFEQHPTQPHYGLDDPTQPPGSQPSSWDQVTWGDIAPAAVFLAADDSRWITGETLYIAGGYR